jgi:hypothetical protein
MWRSVIAVILLPALTAAQTDATIPAQSQESRSTRPDWAQRKAQGEKATYERYTFYSGLRRGREEEVAIVLSANGLVTTAKSPVSGIVPLKLELQPSQGLTVSNLRYPKTARSKVKFRPDRIPTAWWPVIRFTIRADRQTTLGERVLAGKLTFQAIPWDRSAPGPVQQVDVQIPLTVVEHGAKVHRAQWPVTGTPTGLIVAFIVLSPVLVPAGLILMSVCGLTTGEIACE